MSKFRELCDAYSTALSDLGTYKKTCREFTAQLVNGMMDYFEVPKANWRYVPYDEKPEPNAQYGLGRMNLEDDGYWHAAIELKLWETPQADGLVTLDVELRPIKFHFFIRKEDNDFLVKINPEHDGHRISPEVESSSKQFYDFLFQMLKGLESNFEILLGQTETEVSLGFGALRAK
jgi:hypothetical protein